MASVVAGDDGYYPRMARDDGSPKHPLVPGRSNNDTSVADCPIKRRLNRRLGEKNLRGRAGRGLASRDARRVRGQS